MAVDDELMAMKPEMYMFDAETAEVVASRYNSAAISMTNMSLECQRRGRRRAAWRRFHGQTCRFTTKMAVFQQGITKEITYHR